MKKDDEITKEKMLAYISARIEITRNHKDWYKKFQVKKSYIDEELKIQEAIKKIIEVS